jgi:O-antigen ligase
MAGLTALRPRTLYGALSVFVLFVTLLIPGFTGGLAPYIVDVVSLLVVIVVAIRGKLVDSYREPASLILLVAFVALTVCFAHDMIYAVNFVPLLFAGPLGFMLASQARGNNSFTMALLSLAGAFVICAIGAVNAFLLGFDRGAGTNFPVITLSNTAMLLGYIAVAGLWNSTSRWRWICLLGPLLGIAIAIITGSRGPLLGVLPLSVLAVVFVMRETRINRALVGGVIGIGAVGLLVAGIAFSGRVGALLEIARDLWGGSEVADRTTSIRLKLYQAGYQAFLDSPWIGHGWANLMASIKPYLATDDLVWATLPQLHNDVMDFLVSAGVVGVAIYVLILASPMVGAMRSAKDNQHTTRVYGALVLLVGYAFAGLTDIMIGFEFHTTYFAALAAIILGFCRDLASA